MSNETQNEKKEFDPTMSFSFFGSWLETLERLRELQGVGAAYNLFISIANYSMYYDTPNFEDGSVAPIFWPVIQREIDLSLKRRGANFFSEEAEERRQQVIAVYSENPSLTIRGIAEMAGMSKSAVGRILKKLKNNVAEVEAEKERELERERIRKRIKVRTRNRYRYHGTGTKWDSGTVLFYWTYHRDRGRNNVV